MAHDIKLATSKIGLRKSTGPDKLKAEHYKYAPTNMFSSLAIFFYSCLAHCHLPLKMLDVNVKPILKKKGLNEKMSSNYRPIALATATSKIFEHALFSKISAHLQTGRWQFGYKASHGTELAIFSLKSIVSQYRSKNTSLLVCFMDASKAFDNVLHAKLCLKLLDRNVPSSIVSIFYFWCKMQNFRVMWDNTMSRSFSVDKSVRQGGVLNPYLFNVYMDGLGTQLSLSGIGCKVDRIFCNNLFYADDIVKLSVIFNLKKIALYSQFKYFPEYHTNLKLVLHWEWDSDWDSEWDSGWDSNWDSVCAVQTETVFVQNFDHYLY